MTDFIPNFYASQNQFQEKENDEQRENSKYERNFNKSISICGFLYYSDYNLQ